MRESCYMALFVLCIFGMTCHDAVYVDVHSSCIIQSYQQCCYHSDQCAVPYGMQRLCAVRPKLASSVHVPYSVLSRQKRA
jgi:hypothetical protein